MIKTDFKNLFPQIEKLKRDEFLDICDLPKLNLNEIRRIDP